MTAEGRSDQELLSRAVATRLIATLAEQPFTPNAAQLAWIDGGDLIAGHEAGPLTRVIAGRYAELLAAHVIGDVSAPGAPGAYIRIWQCARQAFLRSLTAAGDSGQDASIWENEGGALRVGPSARRAPH